MAKRRIFVSVMAGLRPPLQGRLMRPVPAGAAYNELNGDGCLNKVLLEPHAGLGDATIVTVCIKTVPVAMLRTWRGPQALLPRCQGDANTSGRGR